MKRIAVLTLAVLGLMVSTNTSQASWGHLSYSGYQPWWNVFAKRYKCLTPEEERLQKFWHDYYDAMRNFYKALDHIDWVAYYKNHGYQINAGPGCAGGGCGRINYAPVFVSPSLQWAVPAGCAGGPPVGPPYANYGQPMMPMGHGPQGGPAMAGYPMGGPGMGGPGMGGYPVGGPGQGLPPGAMPISSTPVNGAPGAGGSPVGTGAPVPMGAN